MGLRFFNTSCSVFDPERETTAKPVNPDPSQFTLLCEESVGSFYVVEIRYHGCTNYEGRKIMLYERQDWLALRESKVIDPHFFDGHPSPVARFEPTRRGRLMAVTLALNWGSEHEH